MNLIYENKVPTAYRSAFIVKVKDVANRLGINPNWLMAIINWESAGTFSPSITNSIGATGLIQFMPKTAIGLGTTTYALRNMTAVQQMEYVYKYFAPYKSKIKGYVDMYLATIFPLALGKPNDWVIQGAGISAKTFTSYNPAFDNFGNKDKLTTISEIKAKMMSQIPRDWWTEFKNDLTEKKKRQSR